MDRLLLSVLLLLGAVAGLSEGGPEPSAPPPVVTVRTVLSGTCTEIHKYMESVVGSRVIRSTVEFFEMVIRFLAEGAASGLNVIAVYVAEILRVTGVDAAQALPRFTPEGVAAVAQWGLLALIGYWLLTIVLRLLIGVVKKVFWVIKTVLALWLFGLIVTDKNATSDITAVRVGGLVLVCVLLTLLPCGSEKSSAVEHRLSSLEGRLKAVEKGKGKAE